ncbi:MAG: YeeE/YedE family protein [Proteobacteria bacterium]|nr:YeeE/YedE family protein [Pseudomonadota bacterium]MDA0845571.1 YeeE/YedE family protein [Pseudomonadota bacterium]
MAVSSPTTKQQNAPRQGLWSFGTVDKPLLALISCLGLILAGLAGLDTGLTGLALVGLGLLLGMTFMGFQYGFASGWRRFLETGDASSLSLHFLLSAVCALMFIPVSAAGLGPSGSLAPVSVSLFIGAFMFGTGMQLANGCGSGVLFSFGGGSGRMIVALPFFVIGSVLGSMILPPILAWGSLGQIEIGAGLSGTGKLAVNLLLLLGTAGFFGWLSARRGFRINRTMLVATALIGLLCWGVFWVSNHPWGVTFGFTLWGAKIASAAGLPIETFAFWTWPGPQRALAHSVFSDTSSLMDFAMIIGAGLTAAVTGAFAKSAWPNARQLQAAALGGVLMGIGARLSFGCNIGAFLAGTASGSLHGWIWFALALAGSVLGIRLRAKFGF